MTLAGYVGSAADLDAAIERLQAVPGVGAITHSVAVMPPPLCGMLDALPAAAFAAGAGGPRLDVGGIDGLYRAGESLRLTITAPPGQDAHLTIDYFDSKDDIVAHLLPNDIRPDGRVAAGAQVVIGDLPAERERYRVSAPFGTHMIVAVATSRPLFETPPAMLDDKATYLPRLAEALRSQPDARLVVAPVLFEP
jgi:hypothetical protein